MVRSPRQSAAVRSERPSGNLARGSRQPPRRAVHRTNPSGISHITAVPARPAGLFSCAPDGYPARRRRPRRQLRGSTMSRSERTTIVVDRPENCLDVVVDSKARAILVWREDEKQLPAAARRLGIGVVKSVAECLDILTELDSKERAQPTVVDRVMRLLGLKEPASA